VATFIDTNILIYALKPESPFCNWSLETMLARRALGPLNIDPLVYAELSLGFQNQLVLDSVLSSFHIEIRQITKSGLFSAGRAFKQYKARGGIKTNVLPDFLIGANAHDHNIPLLTADTTRYSTYFPTLQLIAPPA
jgi:predicted nucleic acid-binding protein